MEYNISIKGFEGHRIQIRSGGVFSGYKLFVEGQEAQKGNNKTMVLRRVDGTEANVALKPRFLGLDVPQLVIDGKTYDLVRPLQWYEWAWSGMPILMIFTGGALGGALGFVAFSINTKVFRSEMDTVFRFLSTAAISLAAFGVYMLIVFMLFGFGSEDV